MKLNFLLLILLSISVNILSAQSLKKVHLTSNYKDQLDSHFKTYETFTINFSDLAAPLNTRSNHKVLQLSTESHVWNLDLFEYSLYSSDFVRSVGTDNGVERTTTKPKVRTFLGDVKDARGGETRITVADNFFAGYIEQGGVRYFIEPVRGMMEGVDDNILIVYRESDIIAKGTVECGLDLYNKYKSPVDIHEIESSSSSRSHCLEVEIALANDFTVFQFRGGVNQTESWNANILNMVQANYDNEFQHILEFVQTGSFVATSASSDPWNGVNDINTHLDRHVSWGNGGGYGSSGYDVATAWTRKYRSGAVGLAWVGVICNSLRYNVCSDYGGGTGFIRQLQAHELGHNFSANHDAPGSGFIMAPSVNGSTTWSSSSISRINSHVNSRSCLSICSSGSPPVADFTGSPTSGCAPLKVTFADLSQNGPILTWRWEFPGGNPTTSSVKNPVVTYSKVGNYDVKLTVTNSFGSDVIVFKQYVSVDDKPTASFNSTQSDHLVFFISTSQRVETYQWEFGDGETSTEMNPVHEYIEDGEYEVCLTTENYCGVATTCKKIVIVTPPVLVFFADTTYGCASYTVKFKNKSSNNVSAWNWEFPGGTPDKSTLFEPSVSYNYKGEFDVTLHAMNSKFNTKLVKTKYIKVDTSSISQFNYLVNGSEVKFNNSSSNANTYHWDFGDVTTSTDKDPVHIYGKSGKYTVQLITTSNCGNDTSNQEITIQSTGLSANFKATQKGCAPFTVTFENNSTGATSYNWSFPGGTPNASTEKNPVVTYSSTGSFDVSLIVSDGTNTVTANEVAYIHVGEKPTAEFTLAFNGFNTFFTNSSLRGSNFTWEFGDGELSSEMNPTHTYKAEGEYLVRLIVTNDCGTAEFVRMIAVYLIPKVNFTSNYVEICQGDTVQFIDLSSIDVISWNWQFESGDPLVSTEKNPQVRFPKTGVFAIKLTVKNSNGENSLTKTAYLKVYSNVLCPDFKYEITSDINGEPVVKPKDRKSFDIFTLVPNPVANEFTISAKLVSESAMVEIYNMYGHSVLSKKVECTQPYCNEKMNIAHLPSGSYMITLSSENFYAVRRFIKI